MYDKIVNKITTEMTHFLLNNHLYFNNYFIKWYII